MKSIPLTRASDITFSPASSASGITLSLSSHLLSRPLRTRESKIRLLFRFPFFVFCFLLFVFVFVFVLWNLVNIPTQLFAMYRANVAKLFFLFFHADDSRCSENTDATAFGMMHPHFSEL